jgi:hypothetical protein
MSNAATMSPTATATTVRPQLIETLEQARCLNCDAAIPREFVFRNVLAGDTGGNRTRRTVKAWCEHCQTAMAVTQVLRGGVWCDENEGGAIVTDERTRKGIIARVAHVRGDVQRAQDA